MTDNIPNNRLTTIVDRLERIAEDRKGLLEDFNEILKEAKSEGWDQGAIRRLIRYRAKDPAKRNEEESIDALYRSQAGEI